MDIKSFIYVYTNNLLRLYPVQDIVEDIRNRTRVHKYVFLSKYFHILLDFDYNTFTNYLYGPYSEVLAKEYYTWLEYKTAYNVIYDSNILNFLHFVKVKHRLSNNWLEIATTLLAFSKYHTIRDSLLNHVKSIKYWAKKRYISIVFNDLQRHNLLRYDDL